MPYATLADLAAYGLPVEALADIPPLTQQAELDAAEQVANGYLRVRYKLPLVSFNKDLTQMVCRLAAYRLLCVRGFNPEGGFDEQARLSMEDAERWLKRVAVAQIDPGIVDSTPEQDETVPIIASDCPRGW